MPFGSIPWNRRFGIANYAYPNASGFGSAVLNLPVPFPVYQQQIVRNLAPGRYGPTVDAAWCGNNDDDYNRLVMIRSASPIHHFFGRRNLTEPVSN